MNVVEALDIQAIARQRRARRSRLDEDPGAAGALDRRATGRARVDRARARPLSSRLSPRPSASASPTASAIARTRRGDRGCVQLDPEPLDRTQEPRCARPVTRSAPRLPRPRRARAPAQPGRFPSSCTREELAGPLEVALLERRRRRALDRPGDAALVACLLVLLDRPLVVALHRREVAVFVRELGQATQPPAGRGMLLELQEPPRGSPLRSASPGCGHPRARRRLPGRGAPTPAFAIARVGRAAAPRRSASARRRRLRARTRRPGGRKRPRAHAGGRPAVQIEQRLESRSPLAEPRAPVPERFERARDGEAERGFAALEAPVECGADVVELGRRPREPERLESGPRAWVRASSANERTCIAATAQTLRVGAGFEALGARASRIVRASRTARQSAHVRLDSKLRERSLADPERRRVRRPAAAEHGEALEGVGVLAREELAAPLDRAPKRPLALRRSRAPPTRTGSGRSSRSSSSVVVKVATACSGELDPRGVDRRACRSPAPRHPPRSADRPRAPARRRAARHRGRRAARRGSALGADSVACGSSRGRRAPSVPGSRRR